MQQLHILAINVLLLNFIDAQSKDVPHAHIHEYQLMYADAERVKKDDLSLLAITTSSIHGRGVTLTRPVEKDTSIGTLFYEIKLDGVEEYITETNIDGYWHARGYITDGGKIDKQYMPVKDALNRCNDMPTCKGITFEDPDKLFANPSDEIPSKAMNVEFKDKTHFGIDSENSWQSYFKNPDNLAAAYFPLGCSADIYLSNPPPVSLDPDLMIPCWPRYVNHSCNPTAVLVKVKVDKEFVLPGVPWKEVVGAYQVVVLQDMGDGDEITLNYEELPNYMMRRVQGVDECDKQHDEL